MSLAAILANQGYWIVNMHNAYKKVIILNMNTAIEKATYMELTERNERGGGFSAYSLYPATGDTSRYIKKTIRGADTMVDIVIDRYDPNANNKIVQYLLNSHVPLNISRLNEIFSQEMQSSWFSIKDTYVEHYDLKGNRLISSSRTDSSPASELYVSSDMIVIDIMNSMGVKAYITNSDMAILRRMILQIVLSVLLIAVTIAGLFFLGRTIVLQWKKEKMRQDFVNMLTHELRRPISAAVTFVSLIPYYLKKDTEKDTEKVLQYVTLTMDELNKLTAYTHHIQQISNNDKSTLSLDKSEIEIRPFLESLIKNYLPQEKMSDAATYNKPAEINLYIRPEHPVIHADRLHFANVVENLIENAIKYSGENVVIDISVDCVDRYLRISVKDNGMGISAYDIKRVFDRFYRSNRREVKQEVGFGLGLTYVKSVVSAHGGRVEANSRGVGFGSEFVVFMPVSDLEII
jgi:signal transduction histidine kinase